MPESRLQPGRLQNPAEAGTPAIDRGAPEGPCLTGRALPKEERVREREAPGCAPGAYATRRLLVPAVRDRHVDGVGRWLPGAARVSTAGGTRRSFPTSRRVAGPDPVG